jgi:hypothetical protein
MADLSQAESTLLESYARRLVSLIAQRNPQVERSTIELAPPFRLTTVIPPHPAHTDTP